MARKPRKSTPEAVTTDAAETIQETTSALAEILFPANNRRKPWEQLSPNYRRRLQREGITPEEHARGRPLQKARGHVSPQRESERSQYRRQVNRFVTRLATHYGRDEDDIRDALSGHSEADIRDAMARQRDMAYLYDTGDRQSATALWNGRDRNFPDWLYFYHGAFS